MKKTFKIAIFLSLVIALMCVVTSCDFSGFFEKRTSSGLVYKINNDGKTCTITQLRSSTVTDLTIPSEIEGYRVTSIGSDAFFECIQLNSVTLPDTLTHIGEGAFYGCVGLDGIKIPASVTQIDNASLYYVRNIYITNIEVWIKSFQNAQPVPVSDSSSFIHLIGSDGQEINDLIIPEGVTNIGAYAFYGCSSLTNVVFPESVTQIGSGAFENCKNLVSVTLPKGLKEIGRDAFSNCILLETITIPEGITSIAIGAFSNCKHATVTLGHQNLENFSRRLWEGLNPKSLSVIVSEGVTDINESLFQSLRIHSNITDITLPNSLISIGRRAFSGCVYLTNIIIPDGVTSIGSRAFEGCRSLESVLLPNSVTQIDSFAFSDCKSLKNVRLPDNLKELDGNVFSGCSSLEEIIIPNGMTNIGDEAFNNCISLTNVILPESLTSLGLSVFSGCTSLTNVVLPKSLTSLTLYTFKDCTSLTNILLPDQIKSLDLSAFTGCIALKSITIPKSVIDLSGTLSGLVALESIEVSKDNRKYYSKGNCIIEENGRGVYLVAGCNKSVIPEEVTYINSYAFEGFDELINVVIPEGVQIISAGAFSRCKKLESITIPNTVTGISSNAFQYCDSLTNILISDDHPVYYSAGNCIIKRENNSLVWGCKNSVIPENVTSISYDAFKGCIGLTNIEVPNSVEYIYDSAFQDCTSLMSITIHDSTIAIGRNVFSRCSNLTSIIFEGTVEQWNAIIKSFNWNSSTSAYTIYCSDGEIAKDGTVTYY